MIQGGTEARYQNYTSISKNLRFSTVPWYDLQAYSDDEEHMCRQAQRLPADNTSDSGSDSEYPAVAIVNEAVQVGLCIVADLLAISNHGCIRS